MGGAESIPEREGGDVHGRIVVHTIVIGRDQPGRMSTCKDARATTGPGASTYSPPLSREDGNSPRNAETHRNDRPQKLPDRDINKATRKRRANVASLASHWSPSVVPNCLAFPSSARVTKTKRSWSTLHPSHGRPRQMQPPILVSFFRASLQTTRKETQLRLSCIHHRLRRCVIDRKRRS